MLKYAWKSKNSEKILNNNNTNLLFKYLAIRIELYNLNRYVSKQL